MTPISMTPIGFVTSSRKTEADDNWDAETAVITLDEGRFSSESLHGLDAFSHVEILYFLDRMDPQTLQFHARHPRENGNWPKVGIFAQRAAARPNRIAATICRIRRVDGLTLEVEGLDALDGSPVLDIKPWMDEFGPRGATSQPDWATELMKEYWNLANPE